MQLDLLGSSGAPVRAPASGGGVQRITLDQFGYDPRWPAEPLLRVLPELTVISTSRQARR